jgi:hypothetical protein
VHREYHVLLREELEKAGFPPSLRGGLGGKGGGTDDWIEYLEKDPLHQVRAFAAICRAGDKIDAKYGTQIVQAFWDQLKKGKYTSIP